jgi:VanZ family protein
MYIIDLFTHLRTKMLGLGSRFYLILATIWTALTLYLSLLSAQKIQAMHLWKIPGMDKIAHTIFYLCFSFLWCMALSRKRNLYIWILIMAICFGIAMEWAQYRMLMGRAFESLDIIANSVGAGIGIIIFKWVKAN